MKTDIVKLENDAEKEIAKGINETLGIENTIGFFWGNPLCLRQRKAAYFLTSFPDSFRRFLLNALNKNRCFRKR